MSNYRDLVFLFVLAVVMSSCRPAKFEVGLAKSYLPTAEQLQMGVINKYYFHYNSNDGFEKSTIIKYYEYKSTSDGRLLITIYNAGLKKEEAMEFVFDVDRMLLNSHHKISQDQQIDLTINENVYYDWADKSSNFSSTTKYLNGATEERKWSQINNQDTLILNRAAKQFILQRTRKFAYLDSADKNYSTTIRHNYVSGIGLFSGEFEFKDGLGQLEFIRQMNPTEFINLQKAVPERVAYIDPAKAFDVGEGFQPCQSDGRINDYYNGGAHSLFSGGKRKLKSIFQESVDPVFLKGESGFLTFRFVVNCKGETGRFTTEQADLNYQAKTFNPATVEHLYLILKKMEGWQPVELKQRPNADAYAYLTIKLKDGEIFELLP